MLRPIDIDPRTTRKDQPIHPKMNTDVLKQLRQAQSERSNAYTSQMVNVRDDKKAFHPAAEQMTGQNRLDENRLSKNVREAMVDNADPRESLKTVRNVLLGPSQRLNEARLDEIITMLEEIDVIYDKKARSLTKQFADLSATVNDQMEKSFADLNKLIVALSAKVDGNLATVRKETDEKFGGLSKTTSDKIYAMSNEIDARDSKLSRRINNRLNSTLSDLSQAIIKAGDMDWQNDAGA